MNLQEMKNRNWFPNTVAACSAVLLAFFLLHLDLIGTFFSFLWHIISPLIAGGIIAYMIDPIARFFERKNREKKRFGRKTAVALACIVAYGSLILLFLLLTPSILKSLTMLISDMDSYETTIISFLKKYGFDSARLTENVSTLVQKVKEIIPLITKGVMESSAKMTGILENIGLGCILAIYFMLYKENIIPWVTEFCRKVVHEDAYPEFAGFCSRCDTILLRYLACSLLEAVFVGVSNAVFMLIFRIPNVALISVLVGVTNLAPTFGPLIGGAIGFVILALVNPGYALLFLLFTCVIQTIDGYVVKPKLFGNSLGVSSLWILIAIICGGKIFGVAGVLLAIPFAAIVQYLLEEILFPKVKEERENRVRKKTVDKDE